MKKHSSPFILYTLLLIFFLPIIGAYLFYFYKDSLPFTTLNNGILVRRPENAEKYSFYKATSNNTTSDNISDNTTSNNTSDKPISNKANKQWQLIYLSNNPCDAVCQTMQQTITQIPLALGKYKGQLVSKIIYEHPTAFHPLGPVFVIDPQGFIILYYKENTEARKILKDIQRLLRTSSHA